MKSWFVRLALAALAIILALLLLLLAMTQPRIATPIVNTALGDRVSVERAWLRFPALLSLEFRNASLFDSGRIDRGTVLINPLGILPGLSLAKNVDAAGGQYTADTRANEAEEQLDIRRWVQHLSLENIDITIQSEQGTETAKLTHLQASTHSGELSGKVDLNDGRISFDGRTDNLDIRTWKGIVKLEGDNLAYAARIMQISAPDTPPYQLKLNISAEKTNIETEIETGQIGDSDLSGEVNFDLQTEPPTIQANLSSKVLDFDDLGILFGIPVGLGEGETVGAAQRRAREAYEEQSRLIPNAFIDVSRLDALDGTIEYRAQRATCAILDIQSFALDLEISDRIVRISPAELQFARGTATGFVTLDATIDPAITDIKAELRDVGADALSLDPFLTGTLNGQLQLSGTGNGFRAFANTVSGQVDLWSEDANLIAIAAEAAGLDLIEALLVSGPQSDPADRTYTEIRCLVARLEAEDGVAKFAPAILDTNDSTVILDGQLLPGEERLDFDVRAEAKDASWGAILGDVSVEGTFRDPEFNFFGPETVFQLTIAGLLTAAAGPLGALPFIEPGAGNDYPCKFVMERAHGSN